MKSSRERRSIRDPAQELSVLVGVAPGDRLAFEIDAQFTFKEPQTSVRFDLERGSVRRTLALRAFAYSDRELIEQSETWTLAVLPVAGWAPTSDAHPLDGVGRPGTVRPGQGDGGRFAHIAQP